MTTDYPLPELEIVPHTRKAIPVTKAEELVLSAVRIGEAIQISTDHDVTNANDWGLDQIIRADFLRHMIVNSVEYRIHPKGLAIIGAYIVGHLIFENIDIQQPLWIFASRFDKGPAIHEGSLHYLTLSSCHVPGLEIIGAKINGHVSFNNSTFTRTVRLLGVHIEGNLECTGTKFKPQTNDALNAANITITGYVSFVNTTAFGELNLSGATIHDDLLCTDSIFHNADGCAFNGSKMVVEGRFVWQQFNLQPKGFIVLNQAHVGEFIDDGSAWSDTSLYSIDGFVYGRIDPGTPAQRHIEWVKRMASVGEFRHQPWEQARRIYQNEGNTNATRQVNIAYEAAKAQFTIVTAHPLTRPFWKLGFFLFNQWTGYGYNLFRVLWWLVPSMFLFLGYSWFAYHHGSIVPTEPRIYMSTCYLDLTDSNCPGWELHPRSVYVGGAPQPLIDTPPLRVPQGYPAFHSFLYTLDTFIPFADLHQEAYWTVTDDGAWGEWMRAIFSLFIGLGGVLSAIFAAGMLSLIRKN